MALHLLPEILQVTRNSMVNICLWSHNDWSGFVQNSKIHQELLHATSIITENMGSIYTWQNLYSLLHQSSSVTFPRHPSSGFCLVSTHWSCDSRDDVVVGERRDWGSSVSQHYGQSQDGGEKKLVASQNSWLQRHSEHKRLRWLFSGGSLPITEATLTWIYIVRVYLFCLSNNFFSSDFHIQPNQIFVCYLQSPIPPFDIAFCHLKGYRDQF